ncbi:MAG: ribosomal protein S18-alanine N-acetyltransferase [Acutalibacteraceae bacterium]
MNHITITPMERKHLDSLVELEKICFSQPWSYKSLEEELTNDTAYFYVALKDDEVVGYIGLYIVCESCFITNVAVFPQYRNQGIATALIRRAFLAATSHGTDFISLEVRKSNTKAISLYETLQFEEMGVRKNYYRNPPEDALIMTRLFTKET